MYIFNCKKYITSICIKSNIALEYRMNRNLETDNNEPVFTIGIAAKKLGISVPSMRMYEHEGLLLPFRTDTGRRIYSQEDILRVDRIKSLIKSEGLNLEGIRRLVSLIPCWEIKKCSMKERKGCSAYYNQTKPCWMLNESGCPRNPQDCRTCEVYQKATINAIKLKELLKTLHY